jgi:hypothetical protein
VSRNTYKIYYIIHYPFIATEYELSYTKYVNFTEQYVIFCIGDVFFIFFNVFYLVYLSYHCYNSSCIYVTIGSNIAKDIHITQTDIPNRGSIMQNKTVTVSLMYHHILPKNTFCFINNFVLRIVFILVFTFFIEIQKQFKVV